MRNLMRMGHECLSGEGWRLSPVEHWRKRMASLLVWKQCDICGKVIPYQLGSFVYYNTVTKQTLCSDCADKKREDENDSKRN